MTLDDAMEFGVVIILFVFVMFGILVACLFSNLEIKIDKLLKYFNLLEDKLDSKKKD